MADIPSPLSVLSKVISDETELQAMEEWLKTKPEM